MHAVTKLRLSLGLMPLALALATTAAPALAAVGLPDLTPTSLTAAVKAPSPGGNCEARITAFVANIGTANAGQYGVRFTIDAGSPTQQVLDLPVPNGTNAGRTTTKSVGVVVRRGTHTVDVVADAFNMILESNEDNNGRSGTFTCG